MSNWEVFEEIRTGLKQAVGSGKYRGMKLREEFWA